MEGKMQASGVKSYLCVSLMAWLSIFIMASPTMAQAQFFSDSTRQDLCCTWYNHGLAFGDIDGDQELDIIFANNFQRNAIFLNDGYGNFSFSSCSLENAGPSQGGVAVGDIDRDDDLDVVTGAYYGANGVYLNDGSGNFLDSGDRFDGGAAS